MLVKTYTIVQFHYDGDTLNESFYKAHTPTEAIKLWKEICESDYDIDREYYQYTSPDIEVSYEYIPDVQARPHARSIWEWHDIHLPKIEMGYGCAWNSCHAIDR